MKLEPFPGRSGDNLNPPGRASTMVLNERIVYLRVSTNKQDTKSQEHAMRKWLEEQNLTYQVLTDTSSGKANASQMRQELLQGVKSGKVKEVVVWRLDRMGRSLQEWSEFLSVMIANKVKFTIVTFPCDINDISGQMILNILMSIAEWQRKLIGENTCAGLAAAKARGKKLGGDRLTGITWISKATKAKVQAIRDLSKAHHSIYAIAKMMRINTRTVVKILYTPDSKLMTKDQAEALGRKRRGEE